MQIMTQYFGNLKKSSPQLPEVTTTTTEIVNNGLLTTFPPRSPSIVGFAIDFASTMATPRVFIIRHGETEWSLNGRYDTPL